MQQELSNFKKTQLIDIVNDLVIDKNAKTIKTFKTEAMTIGQISHFPSRAFTIVDGKTAGFWIRNKEKSMLSFCTGGNMTQATFICGPVRQIIKAMFEYDKQGARIYVKGKVTHLMVTYKESIYIGETKIGVFPKTKYIKCISMEKYGRPTAKEEQEEKELKSKYFIKKQIKCRVKA